MTESTTDRAIRRHKRVWRFFKQLVAGGYPENDATMRMARRSVAATTDETRGER